MTKKVKKQSNKNLPSKSQRNLHIGARSFNTKNLGMLIFVSLFTIMGSYFLYTTYADSNNNGVSQPKRFSRFQEDPVAGLHWNGLRSNKSSTICKGDLLEVVDSQNVVTDCTHGPDPAPEGVDVRVGMMPVRTGEVDSTSATSGTALSTAPISCDGDGTTGNRTETIYVHASDKPDRYATYLSSFQSWASNANNIFVESGLQTGSARSVRFVTDASCQIIVRNVTVSPTGDDTFGTTKSELNAQGYNRSDRKYMVWVDASVYCGIGNISYDDSFAQTNANNRGPTFTRIDSGCWGGQTEAHELSHTLGSVQLTAPHTTGGAHCTDEYDRMCYADSTGTVMTYTCPSTEESHFDCNKDDYFNTNPAAGSYLASHWNMANSSFLIAGTPIATNPTPVPTPTSDVISPVISISSPLNGASIGSKVLINASATDNTAVTKMEVYTDGVLKVTSTGGSISYNWSTRRASVGNHVIVVKAYDAFNNFGQSSINLTK